jgi:hypothetical protein
LNPSVRNSDASNAFVAMQLVLRIHIAQVRLAEWVAANATSKAVLAQSAAVDSGRKNKRSTPGARIYSLLVVLRQRLTGILEKSNTSIVSVRLDSDDVHKNQLTDRPLRSQASIGLKSFSAIWKSDVKRKSSTTQRSDLSLNG